MTSYLRPRMAGLFVLALAGCHSKTDQQHTTAATDTSKAGVKAVATPPIVSDRGSLYETYRGLFAAAADSFTLHLTRVPPRLDSEDAIVSGIYYGADMHPLELEELALQSTAPDSMLLQDVSDEALPTGADGQAGSVWRLHREPNGNWTGTRAGQSLRLRRVSSTPGGMGLAIESHSDTIAAYPGSPQTPYGEVSMQGLTPVGPATGTAAGTLLASNILREERGDFKAKQAAPASLDVIWASQRRAFKKEYREVAEEMRPLFEDTTESFLSSSLYYYHRKSVNVWVHQPPLLSLGFADYSFSGGNHRLGDTQLRSFDLRTGKALSFDDIFLPKARTQLPALLIRYARRTLHTQAGEALIARLSEPDEGVSTNVCLTPRGVVFSYSPYETVPTSYEEARLFVPFAELRPWLRDGLPLPARAGVAVR
ncbi:hypothetical protein [Hymenobacter glaciei]